MTRLPVPKKRFAMLLPLLFVAPLTLGFSNTEFACEEAYATMRKCCGDSTPYLNCVESCNADPDLSFQTADCIRRSSCDELVAAGACSDSAASVCQ